MRYREVPLPAKVVTCWGDCHSFLPRSSDFQLRASTASEPTWKDMDSSQDVLHDFVQEAGSVGQSLVVVFVFPARRRAVLYLRLCNELGAPEAY